MFIAYGQPLTRSQTTEKSQFQTAGGRRRELPLRKSEMKMGPVQVDIIPSQSRTEGNEPRGRCRGHRFVAYNQ